MNRLRHALAAGAIATLAAVAAGEEARTNTSLRLAVELVDGSRLLGRPAVTSAPIRTAYARMDISLALVAAITMAGDHEKATVDLQNGDKLQGILDLKALEMDTLFGKVSVTIPSVRSLHVLLSGGPPPQSLVFWNKLGSEKEVLTSVVGPGLTFYEGGGWPEVSGTRNFVPGKHGGAATLIGAYQNMSRVHNLVLKNLEKLLNPERGCIEAWYYQEGPPVAYAYGVYRIFDGPYGIGSGVSLHLMPEGLSFGVGFGGQGRGASLPAAEIPNREWIHLAGAWDRQGLDGSPETLRLYVNGKKVAAAKEKDWGTNAAGQADIAGGNDGRCAGKFFVDNLKIWNCAKTDFSDRDRE